MMSISPSSIIMMMLWMYTVLVYIVYNFLGFPAGSKRYN